ncbi:unnamed protein product, partial [Tetraodon nigroviridis]
PKPDSNIYSITRLFEAVARRDTDSLANLHRYLHQNMKKLSDPLYQSHGKSALMKALLHLKDGKNETVELLIRISEQMGDLDTFVNLAYTSAYYKGQTALHVAIERRSISYVKLLVSKGADVHARACGRFFQPHNGPNFYFGELPLSLAACTNQPLMVDFLLDQRADPKQRDSYGNTVLHALVVVADNSEENTKFITSMYDHILVTAARLYPKLKLEDIQNRNGLTPLTMATKTGKSGVSGCWCETPAQKSPWNLDFVLRLQLFSHILKREFQDSDTKHLSRKFTEWVYGPVTCFLYDLASVDSYHSGSALEILVYGSDIPNRLEMLQEELLAQLLESKWKRFASKMFLSNFIFYLVYLFVFTAVAYNKKDEQVSPWAPPTVENTPVLHSPGLLNLLPQLAYTIEHTFWGYLYVSGQLLTALANGYFFIVGILDMRKKRLKLQALLIDGYYEILFLLQAFLFLISAVLYLSGQDQYLGFLVMSLALSWVNLLYFSRGNQHMGVYSIMIQKMILSDILRFLFVYGVFLLGFSAAVVTLLIEPPVRNITSKGRLLFSSVGPEECVKPTYRNISYTMLELFKFTIGMGDMEFTEDYKYKEVFYVLLIGYIILTYILLLNMLIALMNRTVETTAMESTSIWRLQRAITIMDMERRLPCCLRTWLRCGAEKNLGSEQGDDRRWCFRVEEVNWNKWNIHLGKIDEDPG